VDEDRVVHSRNSSISSLIFGVNALFTKPGQSLAPILGWRILRMTSLEEENYYIFTMVCLVPFLCAISQAYLWNLFTLKGFYLKEIKRKLSQFEYLL
jgi:hypothetical protein